ncbi:MAG: metal-dependent transcriptional regulator [Candidatus Marsarchaeota archaeon]
MQISISDEDYLLVIYELLESRGEARTGEIAKIIGIAPASAEDKMGKLIRDGLLTKNGRGSFEFTEKGYELALAVVRKHRLAERLLTDLLGVNWAEAHDESRVIEHAIDDKIASLIEGKLDAKFCPHGNPIPDKDGHVVDLGDLPLSKLRGKAVITRVTYEEFDTLRVVEALGLTPGSSVRVEKRGADLWVVLSKDGSAVRIPKDIQEVIRGKPLELQGSPYGETQGRGQDQGQGQGQG